jgi:hypothetical protein
VCGEPGDCAEEEEGQLVTACFSDGETTSATAATTFNIFEITATPSPTFPPPPPSAALPASSPVFTGADRFLNALEGQSSDLEHFRRPDSGLLLRKPPLDGTSTLSQTCFRYDILGHEEQKSSDDGTDRVRFQAWRLELLTVERSAGLVRLSELPQRIEEVSGWRLCAGRPEPLVLALLDQLTGTQGRGFGIF